MMEIIISILMVCYQTPWFQGKLLSINCNLDRITNRKEKIGNKILKWPQIKQNEKMKIRSEIFTHIHPQAPISKKLSNKLESNKNVFLSINTNV